MSSYEDEIKEKVEQGQDLPQKLDIGMLKYFWQSNPITGSKVDSVPKFLRKLDVLKNFTENELRILSKSLHTRQFNTGEMIFKQDDVGVGFYFLYSGYVDIIVEPQRNEERSEVKHIITLEKFDYFGELALLQQNSIRNANAVARDNCTLLGIFKPDMEELISAHPVVATKLLQSVSLIIANRLFSLTKEVRELKYKVSQLERETNA